MDLICVFPSYIHKDEFFSNFKQVIDKIEDVKDVIDVVDARIPILKFKYKGL